MKFGGPLKEGGGGGPEPQTPSESAPDNNITACAVSFQRLLGPSENQNQEMFLQITESNEESAPSPFIVPARAGTHTKDTLWNIERSNQRIEWPVFNTPQPDVSWQGPG